MANKANSDFYIKRDSSPLKAGTKLNPLLQPRKNVGSGNSASSFSSVNRIKFSQAPTKQSPAPARIVFTVAIIIAFLAAAAAIVFLVIQPQNITVLVNGQQVKVAPTATADDLVKVATVKTTPGDLLAVDGTILLAGGGDSYTLTLNGEAVDKLPQLHENDRIVFGRGNNVEEPAKIVETEIPFELELLGDGPVAVWQNKGEVGIYAEKDGETSGKHWAGQTKAPINATVVYYHPNPNAKLLALSFDEGPWTSTPDILAVLAEHGAKATFFNLGSAVETYGRYESELVAAGHQVGSKGYANVYFNDLNEDDFVTDLKRAQDAILQQCAILTTTVRPPGGLFNKNNWLWSGGLIDTLVTWSIDTGDWQAGTTAQSIADTLVRGAYSGAIAVLHDGGTDRSNTVEALRIALPQLVAKGYQFVTVAELIEQSPAPKIS